MPDARYPQHERSTSNYPQRPPPGAYPRRPPGPPRRPAPSRRRRDASPWHWLLLIPIALPLVVPLYNRLEPAFFGLPFYYWCQLAFAGLSAVVVAIVHSATKRR